MFPLLVLSVFTAFCFGSEFDGNGKEFGVLVQDSLQFPFVQKLLRLFIDVKDNVGTTLCSCPFRNLKFGASITNPSCGLCAFLIRKGLNLHLMSDHKGRIKPETK